MRLLTGRKLFAVDTETTGMNPADGARLVEVARVAVIDGALGEEWASLVQPGVRIPPDASRVHGITDAMVAGAPGAAQVGRMLREALADTPLVFHNAPFDLPFLRHLFHEAGAAVLANPVVDTLGLARGLFSTGGNSLGALTSKLGLPAESAHRALADTRMTARLFLALAERWERDKGVTSLEELAAASADVMRTTARR